MLQNELLDVQKFADTAENEPFEVVQRVEREKCCKNEVLDVQRFADTAENEPLEVVQRVGGMRRSLTIFGKC